MSDQLVSGPITVGFDSRGYGSARNVYAPVDGVGYVKRRRLPVESFHGRKKRAIDVAYIPMRASRSVNLTHTWNRVNVGGGLWGVSFESELPLLNSQVFPRMHKFLRHRLAAENCRFILAMSNYARRRLLDSIQGRALEAINQKLQVVYPHQGETVRSMDFHPPSPSQQLEIILVGKTFFGKGGEAALRAIEEVGDELNLSLTVVGRVDGRDFVSVDAHCFGVDSICERIIRNPRIRWHESLPNSEVLNLMERAHVALHPTLLDTFGYVILEYMSLGVPLICSNVQALPEMTGPETGWQLQLDCDESGFWISDGIPGWSPHFRKVEIGRYRHAIESMTPQIVNILRSIRENPDRLMAIHHSSLQRVRTQFDPVARSAQMLQIYQRALDR